MLEIIIKHYYILGQRMPIELHLYDNGNGWKVVAIHPDLDFTVSTNTGDNMDNSIVSSFESIFKTNMERFNITNINEYIKFRKSVKFYNMRENKPTIVLIENPDNEDNESFMVGNVV